jgi:serine/threonine protein kinase
MAEVRDGWDTRLGRAVAVKLLYPPLSLQPGSRVRFETEARAAAGLNHPHIVAVHDSGEHEGTPYLVMERLSGRTLADLIARGPLPQSQVRSVLDDVLSALTAAHAAGILHRDIKPGNILIADAGGVKVGDFGIAKSAETAHTVTGQIVGTMAYLSAERIAGRPASVADDLYALGVVGYEALTGRPPFPQQNVVELAAAIAGARPVPLAVLRPGVDAGLAAVIERAMARGFDNAAEMRSALSGRAVTVRPPTRVLASPLPDPATTVVPVPARGRRSRVLIGVAAAVAVVVVVVSFVVDSASRPVAPLPADTSTSVPAPSTTFVVPPTTTSAQVDEGNPPKGRGGNGNGNGKGNGHKPKHGEN